MRAWRAAAALVLCVLLSGCNGAPAPEGVQAPGAGSGGITPEEAKQLPPLAPTGVKVEEAGGKVSVLWQGTRSPVARYEVYRRLAPTQSWQQAGMLPALPNDAGQYRWVDPSPVPGATYGVAAISPHGVCSDIATP